MPVGVEMQAGGITTAVLIFQTQLVCYSKGDGIADRRKVYAPQYVADGAD